MNTRKHLAATLLATLTTLLALPAAAQVSVSVGQPGFYGRLDIGGFPPPPLLFPQPMIIRPAPVAYPPIYLRVPDRHAHDWRHYCGRYGACGRPVYFVQDNWYRHEYAPAYRERHPHHDRGGYGGGYNVGYGGGYDGGGRGDHGHGHGHGEGRGGDHGGGHGHGRH